MEWKREFAGYEEKTADQMVEGYVEAGGVAFKQREEGMEMGSGPHFQGYTVFSLSPLQILEQSKKVSRAGLDDDSTERKEALSTITNYLDWQQAIHGGSTSVAFHKQLVAEDRPMPTLMQAEQAVAILRRQEQVSQSSVDIEQVSQSLVDIERYRRNAQGIPGDGTTDPCTCGHQYHRHFDWMDDYREGCKYCPCQEFTEPTKVGLYGGRDK